MQRTWCRAMQVLVLAISISVIRWAIFYKFIDGMTFCTYFFFAVFLQISIISGLKMRNIWETWQKEQILSFKS